MLAKGKQLRAQEEDMKGDVHEDQELVIVKSGTTR